MYFSAQKFPFLKHKGITLFEMLIVLTVTLILSLIFIYSTKHLVVRTKVERVKEEHRVLSRALQNYRMDYNDYPFHLNNLNAPTAYISTLPKDLFVKNRQWKDYAYIIHPTEELQFILVSVGPDGDSDLYIIVQKYLQTAGIPDQNSMNPNDLKMNQILETILPLYLSTKMYDPTNGIVSDGDVITISHQ
jgi:competence protein ComGC